MLKTSVPVFQRSHQRPHVLLNHNNVSYACILCNTIANCDLKAMKRPKLLPGIQSRD